jgi:hypothetical protein
VAKAKRVVDPASDHFLILSFLKTLARALRKAGIIRKRVEKVDVE